MKFLLITILSIGFACSSYAQTGFATLAGTLDFLKNGDTVQLTVYKYGYFANSKDMQVVYKTQVNNHSFVFKIPMGDHPQYFNLNLSPLNTMKDIIDYFLETGDQINVEQRGNTYHFYGLGAEKMNVKHHLTAILNSKIAFIRHNDPKFIKNDFNLLDTISISQLNFLDSVRTNISSTAHDLLKADILGDNLNKSYYITNYIKGSEAQPFITALKSYSENKWLLDQENEVERNDNLVYSNTFLIGTIVKFNYDSCYLRGKTFEVTRCYNYLKNKYSGLTREKIISLLLFSKRNSAQDMTYLIKNALGFIKNEDFRNIIEKLQSSRTKGAIAFNFALSDQGDEIHRLSDYKGKVVIMDFWFTGCPGCRELAPYLFKLEKMFKDKPVIFVSICIDKSKASWISSLKSRSYTSDLSVNLFTGGKGRDHAIIKFYEINSYPTLIMIDKSGKVCGNINDPRNDNGKSLIELLNKELDI